MRERFQTLAGITCRVIDTGGSDPSVVFVHGLGGNADNWSLVIDSISKNRRCLALDLPGFGMSSPARNHDLDTHVDAVASLLRTLDDPVTLVGNSMGGLVSARIASEHPDLVTKLVLISPAAPLPWPSRMTDPTVTARLAAQSIPGFGELVLRGFQKRLTPRQQAEYTLRLVAEDFESIPIEVRERATTIARLRREMPWAIRAFSESARSIGFHIVARRRFSAMVQAIRQPTTLIWGTEDRLVAPASMEWLCAQRPDWDSIRLEGIGHVAMFETPEVVIGAVAGEQTMVH